MHKWLLLPLLTLTSLRADGANPEQLNAIYTEAIWFIGIFGAMGIISFIYSSRHAKQYTKEQAGNIAEKKALSVERKKQREKRINELSELLKDGLLTEKEFLILRVNLQQDQL